MKHLFLALSVSALSLGLPAVAIATIPATAQTTAIQPVSEQVAPKDKPSAQDPAPVFSMATVEQKPSFPGGDAAMYKWIQDNLVYPAVAQEEGISGKVIVQFIIEKNGSITSPMIVRGKDPTLDREALRLIKKMPKWTPGRMNGQTVRVRVRIPVSFKL